MSSTSAWEQTLSRRLRALVRTAPLHRIEAGKAARTRDLSGHDLRGLALRAIDATIEQMGLGYGAHREDIAQALASRIRAADASATHADVREITDIVIDHLLNEANRRLQFDEPYVDFDGSQVTQRSVRFRLLNEEDADDGTIVLKATTEAINLYAGMLEVDVEDAQTAAEAVLQAQIERGAISAAVATARQARLRSIEFAEKLRRTLRQVRRDVSRVDLRAMLGDVEAARKHLEARLKVERALLVAVDERMAADEEQSAAELVELRDALDDCRKRHLELHHDLLGINEIWLAEQERQRFRKVRASALPDLERDVLQAMIAAPLVRLEPLIDPLLLVLHGPQAPPVLGLVGLVDALLAPRRREPEADLEPEQDVLDSVGTLETRFTPDIIARVNEWLAVGGTLGGLLGSSRDEGDSQAVRRLLVLRALWAWDPDAQYPLTVADAGSLQDPEFEGDDLAIEVPWST